MVRPPMRGVAWNPDDRTGGALDGVLDEVRTLVPGLVVERITVVHPGNDDDNVYFLGDESNFDLVQVDTHPDGRFPFMVDGDGPETTGDPTEAVQLIVRALRQATT